MTRSTRVARRTRSFSPIFRPVTSAAIPQSVLRHSNASGTGVLGHEIAEWLNRSRGRQRWFPPGRIRPSRTYATTPSWKWGILWNTISHGFSVSLNGRTYQFPEVAFLPWFAGDRHSTSVNGWYSSLNTFSSPSTACPVFTNFGLCWIRFHGSRFQRPDWREQFRE